MSLDALSQARSSALIPTQIKSGVAECKTIANPNAVNARTRQTLLTCWATVGWRVAIETFRCARSNSRSQQAMLMQLSEQSAAKVRTAIAKLGVNGRDGSNATMVPAANNVPIASSFAGSDRQIKPSGWFTTR